MVIISNWNDPGNPREVKVKYEELFAGQFPNEVIVTFSGVNRKVTAILPLSCVDHATGSIKASVVHFNTKADTYLVDLPTYTLTSGSKVWFARDHILEGVK